ncbi:GNAT family N-acetyltransferase [Yinghuangia sp. ASG 101]|uniref:GNAT family N-acetyltransferase n=1 Tax=Yinghuangia sp. ASG 101 TaxID=2896848 RepID=UPI001E3AB636|nr:GNAT family N-acetyltransferase [Yinghuangia sp. ASG 101]UGQ14189.1 GNAT family N-acetyltransferase [Yinghuangia sp. ASG 101]
MENSRVRPFDDKDLPGAVAALVNVHATDGYPVEGVDRPEFWLRSPKVIASWVAEADGKIVGHVAVMKPQGEDSASLWAKQNGDGDGNVAVLARLFVIQEARHQAFGRSLVNTAMRYARRGQLRLVLDVMAKDRSAIRLYEHLGWTKIGSTTHHYGENLHTDAMCYVAPI